MPKENLVPIKLLLFRQRNGQVDYPEFNRIDSDIRNDMPWSHYIDSFGIGWHYDKIENLGTGHDFGTCCTLVPKDFADAASLLFPDLVSIIDEAEWETFYDERCHAREPEEFLDTEVLQGIVARIDLEDRRAAPPPSQSIVNRRAEALDPNDTATMGIRKNENKTWALFKAKTNLTIHSDQRKDT